MTPEKFILKAQQKWKDYNGLPLYKYYPEQYPNNINKQKIIVNCPLHGDFDVRADMHLHSRYCKFCTKENKKKKLTKSTEQFIQEAKAIHDPIRDSLGLPRYDYSITNYIHSEQEVKIICPIHGEFEQQANNHLQGRGCRLCAYNHNSSQEIEIINFLKTIYNGNVIQNFKLPNSKEIDIYLPELELAIEYNGIYWHSEIYKSKNYHLEKTQECEKLNIQLIQIFEDEWFQNTDKIKQYLFELINFGYIKFDIDINQNILYANRRFVSNIKENIYKIRL